MKRIFTLLLTLVMTFSLAIPAQAANNTKASTMRLMETEGTATVENSIGKKLSIQDKMRLYSGYEVSTEKASYAYISLDNNKAVKLDASSAVKVNQSGKKLELDVTAGELMFNVPVALKSDESLNIRSSTMVTGIRGTAGWVNALDRYTTRVGVLEGSVTIQSKDPFTGADRSVTIVGGQIATIIRHERANAIQQQLIDDGVIIEENIVSALTKPGQVVEELQEDNVPGFVSAEVAKDSALQERINNESPLDADKITAGAADRLVADERKANEADRNAQQQLDDLSAKDTVLNNNIYPETIVVTKTETVEVVKPTLNTDNKATDVVRASLDGGKVATVTNSDLDLAQLDVDADETLNIVGGTLGNSADDTVVSGTVNTFGDAKVVNTGTLTINSTNSLHVYSTLENYGDIVIGDGTASGKLVIHPGGTLKNYGTITITDSGSSFIIESDADLINLVNPSDYDHSGVILFDPSYENFILKGNLTDTKNEVYVQNNDVVTYLGYFDTYFATGVSGDTLKVLDSGYLSALGTIDSSYRATLDLNGKRAELSGPYATGLQFSGLSLTVTDSVGTGKLTGSLELSNGATVTWKSGTIAGPVASPVAFDPADLPAVITVYGGSNFYMQGGCVGVPADAIGFRLIDGGYLSMSGGMVDASADGAYALDNPGSTNLQGGRLYGQTPTPGGTVVYADSLGVMPESPFSDYTYKNGFYLGYYLGYRETFAAAYRSGYDNGYYGNLEVDNPYSYSSFDPSYNYEANGLDYYDGYSDGFKAGQFDAYDIAYYNGYDDGYADSNGSALTYFEAFSAGYYMGFTAGQMECQFAVSIGAVSSELPSSHIDPSGSVPDGIRDGFNSGFKAGYSEFLSSFSSGGNEIDPSGIGFYLMENGNGKYLYLRDHEMETANNYSTHCYYVDLSIECSPSVN